MVRACLGNGSFLFFKVLGVSRKVATVGFQRIGRQISFGSQIIQKFLDFFLRDGVKPWLIQAFWPFFRIPLPAPAPVSALPPARLEPP